MLLTLLLISLAACRKQVKRMMSALIGKIAAHVAHQLAARRGPVDQFIVNVRSA
jgi:hypothetical protein